jgi:hypothetical protein
MPKLHELLAAEGPLKVQEPQPSSGQKPASV